MKDTNFSDNKKNVLVTGGAGYIGAHACKLLKEAGYVPVTFDNLSTGNAEAVLYGPLVEGDLCDKEDIQAVFEKYTISAVMHFAALSCVGESVEKPEIYWNNNVRGSMNLLDVMRDAGVQHIIFSSTCAVYGDHDGVLLNENAIQKPTNPYATSKQAIENMIIGYGMRYIIFRYFNAAGADPDSEIGESHNPETHLIPIVLAVASKKEKKVTIFGDDYHTSDGTCVRDYIHVLDIADAHIKGLHALESGSRNAVYNLGSGVGTSVKEIVTAVEEVTGFSVPTVVGDRRVGDCGSLVSAGLSAQKELGWNPAHSMLSNMITDAWHWYTKIIK